MQVNKNCSTLYLYHILKFVKYFLTSFIIKEKHSMPFFPLKNMNRKMAGMVELKSEIRVGHNGLYLISGFFPWEELPCPSRPSYHLLTCQGLTTVWMDSVIPILSFCGALCTALLDLWHSVLPGFWNKHLMYFPRTFPGPDSPADNTGTIKDKVEKSTAPL